MVCVKLRWVGAGVGWRNLSAKELLQELKSIKNCQYTLSSIKREVEIVVISRRITLEAGELVSNSLRNFHENDDPKIFLMAWTRSAGSK